MCFNKQSSQQWHAATHTTIYWGMHFLRIFGLCFSFAFSCVVTSFISNQVFSMFNLPSKFVAHCSAPPNDSTRGHLKKHEQTGGKAEKCLECQVIGVLALSSISLYMGYLRINTPKYDKKQRLFLAAFGLGMKHYFHFLN
jgi:hypothetical protein